jgi:transposase-like protein
MAKRKTFSPEQILMKLREAEVLLSQGKSTKEACRVLENSEQTYYRWRKEYGGLGHRAGQETERTGKRECALEELVADLSLDNAILKEVLSKK